MVHSPRRFADLIGMRFVLFAAIVALLNAPAAAADITGMTSAAMTTAVPRR